jgi:PAS domain S-box-containing protein
MAKWLLYSALMAVGYFLAGRLGQLLAVPPSYATVIWPASGIALAGVLLVGYRILPGVFVGALMVNGWTPLLMADSLEAAASSLMLPASISLGATLQALTGVFLIRRFVGYPNSLMQDHLVWAFLGLGGPVACLVAATWGVASLAFAGAFDGAGAALNWWTWWVGDVIGVIIFTPLILICFARPRRVWQPRLLSVALPLSAAFAVSVLGFVSMQTLEQSRAKLRLEGIAADVHRRLNEQLLEHLNLLHTVESFYASSTHVERSEFATFNRQLLSRSTGTRAIAWLPLIQDRNRKSFETRARAEGLADFTLTEFTTDQPRNTSEGSLEHFPVLYLEPPQSTAISLGFDVASNPGLQKTMDTSRDSGRLVATRPLRLAEHHENQPFIFAFNPIYVADDSLATVTQRRQSLRGFAVGVFDVNDIIGAALPTKDLQDFNLTIVDGSADSDSPIIYAHAQLASPYKASEVAPLLANTIETTATIDVAGRQWLCKFTPTANFYAGQAVSHTWLIFACGLFLTTLLGAFLLMLSGRTARVTASEARYFDLYDNAPDMFISVDVSTQRVIECNQTLLDATDFSKLDVIGKDFFHLFDLDSQEEVRRAFRSFLAIGQAKDIELRLLCSHGQFVETSMNVSAVRDERGESIHCRVVLRDITAKKLRENLIKNQEMELAHVARLSMMGEMAAGLAHEINQPLAAIAAFAEGAAIRIRNGTSDAPGLARVVDRISADAHRAGEVIRRLRQFVRKREPERHDVDLNELVQEVAQFIGPDVKSREICLILKLGEGLPNLRGDSIQIQQVLLNLVRNSCDAMMDTNPAQRKLTICTHFNGQDSIDVDVHDCGHGLSESMDEHVFEAFFSTKEDGLGMGLAISRSIIESHGGQIWATPNLEGGASFHFSLPVNDRIFQDVQRSNSISDRRRRKPS